MSILACCLFILFLSRNDVALSKLAPLPVVHVLYVVHRLVAFLVVALFNIISLVVLNSGLFAGCVFDKGRGQWHTILPERLSANNFQNFSKRPLSAIGHFGALNRHQCQPAKLGATCWK